MSRRAKYRKLLRAQERELLLRPNLVAEPIIVEPITEESNIDEIETMEDVTIQDISTEDIDKTLKSLEEDEEEILKIKNRRIRKKRTSND